MHRAIRTRDGVALFHRDWGQGPGRLRRLLVAAVQQLGLPDAGAVAGRAALRRP
jgi:hypothetical protein